MKRPRWRPEHFNPILGTREAAESWLLQSVQAWLNPGLSADRPPFAPLILAENEPVADQLVKELHRPGVPPDARMRIAEASMTAALNAVRTYPASRTGEVACLISILAALNADVPAETSLKLIQAARADKTDESGRLELLESLVRLIGCRRSGDEARQLALALKRRKSLWNSGISPQIVRMLNELDGAAWIRNLTLFEADLETYFEEQQDAGIFFTTLHSFIHAATPLQFARGVLLPYQSGAQAYKQDWLSRFSKTASEQVTTPGLLATRWLFDCAFVHEETENGPRLRPTLEFRDDGDELWWNRLAGEPLQVRLLPDRELELAEPRLAKTCSLALSTLNSSRIAPEIAGMPVSPFVASLKSSLWRPRRIKMAKTQSDARVAAAGEIELLSPELDRAYARSGLLLQASERKEQLEEMDFDD